ncbi:MAG: LysM peptidoglycan-binding domain-containing protein [Candidatus Tenebribacter davisii]|jgi:nucleoid-associated protein YgaU|nr:LysM peptidoglycan-binding domain-containing protein [Candidatus Tenebribacter davisii]
MKRIIILSLVALLVLPVLIQAQVTYLSEDEYKDLKKKERLAYWEDLETDLANYQQRKADAIADQDKYTARIEELNGEMVPVQTEYDKVHGEILEFLGVTEDDFAGIMQKIKYYNGEIDNWDGLTDKELWSAKKTVKALVADYKDYRGSKYGKVPDFRSDFSDLDNKIANLCDNLENAKPKYYEDDYTIVKGDWLSKIAQYSFIYGDMSKWPVIYRANRDQIKDPNFIYPDQVIKIPRGLPYEWKVYKGECLWKIAGYQEVYGNAAKWPLIFRANKDQIKDPDLIYPNQIFEIPRD